MGQRGVGDFEIGRPRATRVEHARFIELACFFDWKDVVGGSRVEFVFHQECPEVRGSCKVFLGEVSLKGLEVRCSRVDETYMGLKSQPRYAEVFQKKKKTEKYPKKKKKKPMGNPDCVCVQAALHEFYCHLVHLSRPDVMEGG